MRTPSTLSFPSFCIPFDDLLIRHKMKTICLSLVTLNEVFFTPPFQTGGRLAPFPSRQVFVSPVEFRSLPGPKAMALRQKQ
jgi:hypothetical protein